MVNEVVDHVEGAHAAARALAAEIAAKFPLAVEGTKAVLSANEGRTVTQGLEFVATWNAGMLAAHDVTEALAAFMEKRPPKFTGRWDAPGSRLTFRFRADGTHRRQRRRVSAYGATNGWPHAPCGRPRPGPHRALRARLR